MSVGGQEHLMSSPLHLPSSWQRAQEAYSRGPCPAGCGEKEKAELIQSYKSPSFVHSCSYTESTPHTMWE